MDISEMYNALSLVPYAIGGAGAAYITYKLGQVLDMVALGEMEDSPSNSDDRPRIKSLRESKGTDNFLINDTDEALDSVVSEECRRLGLNRKDFVIAETGLEGGDWSIQKREGKYVIAQGCFRSRTRATIRDLLYHAYKGDLDLMPENPSFFDRLCKFPNKKIKAELYALFDVKL